MKHRLLLGAHISTAGGLDKSFERGESVHCTTMQIFVKNNRRWIEKPLTEPEIDIFKETSKKSSLKPVVAHAGYLINLGSPDSLVVKKSIESLQEEVNRCEALGIPLLVFHPGSIGSRNKEETLPIIAARINDIISAVPGSTRLLLEVMAGQGNVIGNRFEDLATIINAVNDKKRIGTCFDTCHAWAAGFDFGTPSTYESLWNHFEKTIGLNQLHAMHLNDSKNGRGSQVDRHEDIGKGSLGLEPFRLIMNDERFFDIPKIIETPKETSEDDLRNLKTLARLISPETQKILEIPEGLLS